MNNLLQDLRYGFRMLLRNPAFTAMAVLSLGLGIGVNTSIFSLVNAAILRPLPVDRPDRLVSLRATPKNGGDSFNLSYPSYLDIRDKNDVFAGVAAARFITVNLSRGEVNERLWGYLATGNYFDLLGVHAALGRTFLPEEDRGEGAHPVVVVSYDCWKNRFASDANIVGRTVLLNGHEFNIIGVAPQGFFGTEVAFGPELWAPMMMQEQIDPGMNWLHNRKEGRLNQVIARFKPGISSVQAQTQLTSIAEQMTRDYPMAHDAGSIEMSPPGFFIPQLRNSVVLFGVLLLAVGGFVVLLACTNLASLLLARAAARRKEIAVRLAIGAGRWRLVRQLLTESSLFSAIGGGVGVFIAILVNNLITAFRPPLDFPLNLHLTLDYRVLLFAIGVSAATGVLFGLLPALQSTRLGLTGGLKDESSGRSRSRARNLLVTAQVALSLLLLVCAGLVLRSLIYAQKIDIGFNNHNALEMSFDVGLQGYSEPQGRQFFGRVLREVSALPGVEAAGLAGYLPLSLDSSGRGVQVDGYQPPKGESPFALFTQVSPDYFKTMGIPVMSGRSFDARDEAAAPRVVIVNEAFVQRYWPGQQAVGKSVRINGASGPYSEIVGVVKNGKYLTLGEAPRPFIYVPIFQEYQSGVTMVVRTKGDPSSLGAAARAVVQRLDSHLPVYDVKTLTEHMSISLLPARLAASLLSIFGALALALAAIGVYGLMLNVVAQRTREIGIRVALGATRTDVLRLIVGRGLALAGSGIALGVVLALGLTRSLQALLYGVSATDPVVFVAVSAGLILLASIASYFPARRAMKIDPIAALRYE
jgi:predicted permease